MPAFSPDSADVAWIKRKSFDGHALAMRRTADVARGVGSIGLRPSFKSKKGSKAAAGRRVAPVGASRQGAVGSAETKASDAPHRRAPADDAPIGDAAVRSASRGFDYDHAPAGPALLPPAASVPADSVEAPVKSAKGGVSRCDLHTVSRVYQLDMLQVPAPAHIKAVSSRIRLIQPISREM